MFRYAVRAHDLGCFDADTLAGAVRAAGFGGIQLAPRKVLAVFPEHPDVSDAASLARKLRDGGVRVDILGCYIEPVHKDEGLRQAAIERFEHEIGLCGAYGTSIIATETGKPWNGGAPDPGSGRPVTEDGSGLEFDLLVRAFRRLCRRAEAEGVVVAVEPVWNHVLATPGSLRALFDSVASPALGLLLDPCNLVSPLLCRKVRDEAGGSEAVHDYAAPSVAMLETAGDRLVALHAKDFILKEGSMERVACGRGSMRWDRVFEAVAPHLRTPGGSGAEGMRVRDGIPLVVEEHEPGSHAEARRYLESLERTVSAAPRAAARWR